MKLFENGVGRPSNEIKKKRKIFIASVVAAVAITITLVSVLLFGKSDIKNLKGASNGAYYMNLSVRNSKVTTSGCTVTIPVEIHNTKKYEIKITGAKIMQQVSDKVFDSTTFSKKLSGNTAYTTNLKFNLKNFSTDNPNFKVTIYFTVSGKNKTYYKYDLYSAAELFDAVRKCKESAKGDNTAETCKKDVKLELNCPSSAKINQSFQCTSNKNLAGVTISATSGEGFSGNNLSWTTTTNDNAKDLKYSTTGTKHITATYICNDKKIADDKASVNIVAGDTQSKTPTSKKTTTAKPKSMKISCDKAVANKEFTCTVKNSSNKKLSKAKISVNTKTDLAKNYKNSGKGSLKLKYTKAKTVKVTATLDGYKTKTVEVKIAKAPTTTAKKETSSLEKYNITTVINKVTKKNNNEKQLEINVKDLGKNVKYVRYKVCLDRAVCVNDTAANNTYLTDFIGVKKGQTNKVNITTLSSALLNQEFYVRIMTYNKNKKLLYWKVNHFYTNPKTDAKSTNKNVSNESKVKVGDYTGTTSDFLVSLKSDKVKSKYQANFRVPSVKKSSDVTLDKGVEKQYNVVMQDFGVNVKYVTFAICNKLSDCTNPNALDIISNDSSKGAILKDQIPEFGKEFIIKTTGDFQILNQKFYVRIYSYDANKVLMFSKYHEFTTDKKSELGVTSDSKMAMGDRVKADITDKGLSQKY